jgi:hypothetical protein
MLVHENIEIIGPCHLNIAVNNQYTREVCKIDAKFMGLHVCTFPFIERS